MGGNLLYSYIPYLESATNGAITLVPEPETYALLAAGLAALALRRRRR